MGGKSSKPGKEKKKSGEKKKQSNADIKFERGSIQNLKADRGPPRSSDTERADDAYTRYPEDTAPEGFTKQWNPKTTDWFPYWINTSNGKFWGENTSNAKEHGYETKGTYSPKRDGIIKSEGSKRLKKCSTKKGSEEQQPMVVKMRDSNAPSVLKMRRWGDDVGKNGRLGDIPEKETYSSNRVIRAARASVAEESPERPVVATTKGPKPTVKQMTLRIRPAPRRNAPKRTSGPGPTVEQMTRDIRPPPRRGRNAHKPTSGSGSSVASLSELDANLKAPRPGQSLSELEANLKPPPWRRRILSCLGQIQEPALDPSFPAGLNAIAVLIPVACLVYWLVTRRSRRSHRRPRDSLRDLEAGLLRKDADLQDD